MNMSIKVYPLQFDPIVKERIWGGEKLKSVLNKPITSKLTGERELSTVEGDVSVIANGQLKGKSLTEVINVPNEILEQKFINVLESSSFFKYLDAREDLFIQVHPNDVGKEKTILGKQKWYIMQADQDARIVGFKEDSNADEYLENLKGKLTFYLDSVNVKEGDAFSRNRDGTRHRAGLLVAEIQQTLTLHTVSMILIESMHKGIQENFM
jgi:mannose-6-phosphate isomerase